MPAHFCVPPECSWNRCFFESQHEVKLRPLVAITSPLGGKNEQVKLVLFRGENYWHILSPKPKNCRLNISDVSYAKLSCISSYLLPLEPVCRLSVQQTSLKATISNKLLIYPNMTRNIKLSKARRCSAEHSCAQAEL